MALDILHDSWGPYTHTEVENALKSYLATLEQRISDAIHEGGIGLDELSQEVRTLLNKANTALQPENLASWAKQQNKPGYTVSEITYDNLTTLAQKLAAMDQAIQAAAQSGTEPDSAMSDSSTNAVQNKIVKAYIDAVSARLDALISTGNVSGAIDTFNEIKAFLADISDSDTLLAKLLLKADKSNTYTKSEVDAAIAAAGSGAVSVTTNNDGTFTINVGNDAYSINLNHTHPNMCKLVITDEEPSNPASDTIYAQVNDASDPTEIESLWIAGLEFVGGGGTTGPALRKPTDGSTINMETSGGVISKTIRVKGNGNLTQALTIEITGTGYSFGNPQPTGVTIVSTTELTVTAEAANAGVDIVVVYSGSKEIATATLSIVGTTDGIDCEVTLNYSNLTALTYIKSTTTQYLVTNYFPNPNTHIEIDMQFEANANQNVGSGVNNAWLGSNGTPTNGAFRTNINSDANQYDLIMYWFEKGYVATTWTGVYSDKIYTRSTWVYKNDKVTFNGVQTTTETKTTTQDKELTLFGQYNAGDAPFQRHNLKLWSVKISENDVLLHEYLPYQRISDGENGLYDTVTGDFFTSETQDNFVGQ